MSYFQFNFSLSFYFVLQSNTQDQILLQWTSGKSATMNILVVHAMIILLTYGSPSGTRSQWLKLWNQSNLNVGTRDLTSKYSWIFLVFFFLIFSVVLFPGESLFNDLLDAWFPETGGPPSAYLIDTSEEALLLPDWLKLRMIRSTISRLIDAGSTKVENNWNF